MTGVLSRRLATQSNPSHAYTDCGLIFLSQILMAPQECINQVSSACSINYNRWRILRCGQMCRHVPALSFPACNPETPLSKIEQNKHFSLPRRQPHCTCIFWSMHSRAWECCSMLSRAPLQENEQTFFWSKDNRKPAAMSELNALMRRAPIPCNRWPNSRHNKQE